VSRPFEQWRGFPTQDGLKHCSCSRDACFSSCWRISRISPGNSLASARPSVRETDERFLFFELVHEGLHTIKDLPLLVLI
jgi:hypothetical protein